MKMLDAPFAKRPCNPVCRVASQCYACHCQKAGMPVTEQKSTVWQTAEILVLQLMVVNCKGRLVIGRCLLISHRYRVFLIRWKLLHQIIRHCHRDHSCSHTSA